jgi:hypothetical protein
MECRAVRRKHIRQLSFAGNGKRVTVHVILPDGHEAQRIVAMLQHISAEVCGDVLELFDARRESLGPLLIAEESLSTAALHQLTEFGYKRPAWSDLPIIILMTEGSQMERIRLLKDQHPMRRRDLLQCCSRPNILLRWGPETTSIGDAS